MTREAETQGNPEQTVTNGGDGIREWTQTAGSLRPDGSHSLTGAIIENQHHPLFLKLAEVHRTAVLEGSMAVVDTSGSVFVHPRPQGGKGKVVFED